MTLFATKLDTLSAKKMTSRIFFLGSYDSLPIEKMLTLHNVIILIKSVLDKDQCCYYCNIFLEKCTYQLAKK